MKKYLLALLLLLWGPVAWGDMTPAEFADLGEVQGYGTYWNHAQENGETVLIGAWVNSSGDVVTVYAFPSSSDTGGAEPGEGDFYAWHEGRFGFSAVGGGGSACNTFVVCNGWPGGGDLDPY